MDISWAIEQVGKMKDSVTKLDYCLHSYDQLEKAIRADLESTTLSYREISAIVGWNHTQIWAFHKQDCKLQFEVLERLSTLFNRPFLISNRPSSRGEETSFTVEALAEATRDAISKTLQHGISYRKVGRAAGISHEWVRCFHIKDASIDVRKLIAIADYLNVAYELSNEKDLRRAPVKKF